MTQRATTPGMPAAGFGAVHPPCAGVSGGVSPGVVGPGVPVEVGGCVGEMGDDSGALPAGVCALEFGGAQVPPLQVQPAPGCALGQFPAPPSGAVAVLALVPAPPAAAPTIIQTPFWQDHVGLGGGVVQFTTDGATLLDVTAVLDGPAPPRGAALDGAPVGSRVITVATGVGFAPKISAASNTSTAASTSKRRPILGTTLK